MLEPINVWLSTGRIVIPDVVVVDADDEAAMAKAHEVRLICEIASPVNAGSGRLLKMPRRR